jgi:hypothetical protein
VRLSTYLFYFAILGTAALGCNEAPLIGAPDAGNPCVGPIPGYNCHQAPTLPGCSGDLHSGGAPLDQEEVLDGGTYPVGCVVIVNDPVPDLDQQCTQLGTCACNADDGGGYSWTCVN